MILFLFCLGWALFLFCFFFFFIFVWWLFGWGCFQDCGFDFWWFQEFGFGFCWFQEWPWCQDLDWGWAGCQELDWAWFQDWGCDHDCSLLSVWSFESGCGGQSFKTLTVVELFFVLFLAHSIFMKSNKNKKIVNLTIKSRFLIFKIIFQIKKNDFDFSC